MPRGQTAADCMMCPSVESSRPMVRRQRTEGVGPPLQDVCPLGLPLQAAGDTPGARSGKHPPAHSPTASMGEAEARGPGGPSCAGPHPDTSSPALLSPAAPGINPKAPEEAVSPRAPGSNLSLRPALLVTALPFSSRASSLTLAGSPRVCSHALSRLLCHSFECQPVILTRLCDILTSFQMLPAPVFRSWSNSSVADAPAGPHIG